jgi:hypothetical protein
MTAKKAPQTEDDSGKVVSLRAVMGDETEPVAVNELVAMIRDGWMSQLADPTYAETLLRYHHEAGEAWDAIEAAARKHRQKRRLGQILKDEAARQHAVPGEQLIPDNPGTGFEQIDEADKSADRPTPPTSMAHLPFEEDAKTRVTEEVNREFAVVQVRNGISIMKECQTEEEDGTPGRTYIDIWDQGSLKGWFANKPVKYIHYDPSARSDHRFKVVETTKDRIWWCHPDRAEYKAIVFDPGTPPEESRAKEIYNLWNGWGVDPDPDASCDMILNHIYEIWAQRDEQLYTWILDWFADIVQNPKDKSGTSLFIVSKEQGTGKSVIFEELLSRVLGRAYVQLDDIDRLSNQFNAYVQGSLLCYLDDAADLDNPRHEHFLKTAITAKHILIEEKHKNAYQISDFKRIAGTLNKKPDAERIVPADEHQRRYTIVEASTARKGDHGYFQALREEIHNGGAEAFLHHLQTRQIGENEQGVKWIRWPYTTRAVRQQAMQNADVVTHFWYQFLDRGGLSVSEADKLQVNAGWPGYVPYSEFYDHVFRPKAYTVRARGEPIPAQKRFLERSQEIFGNLVRKTRPSANNNPIEGRPYLLEFEDRASMKGAFEIYFGIADPGWSDEGERKIDPDADVPEDDAFDGLADQSDGDTALAASGYDPDEWLA